MMDLYKSRAGEVGNLAYWQEQCNKFWSTLDINDTERHSIKRPVDALERMFKVLGITKIESTH